MTGHEIDDIFKTLPDRPLLRVDEVARFLVVTKKTVYALYPNILKGTNVGGMIRIYRQSVVEYVVSNNGKKKSDEQPEEVDKKLREAPAPAPRRRRFVKDW